MQKIWNKTRKYKGKDSHLLILWTCIQWTFLDIVPPTFVHALCLFKYKGNSSFSQSVIPLSTWEVLGAEDTVMNKTDKFLGETDV